MDKYVRMVSKIYWEGEGEEGIGWGGGVRKIEGMKWMGFQRGFEYQVYACLLFD